MNWNSFLELYERTVKGCTDPVSILFLAKKKLMVFHQLRLEWGGASSKLVMWDFDHWFTLNETQIKQTLFITGTFTDPWKVIVCSICKATGSFLFRPKPLVLWSLHGYGLHCIFNKQTMCWKHLCCCFVCYMMAVFIPQTLVSRQQVALWRP